jgi:hypothetical protein
MTMPGSPEAIDLPEFAASIAAAARGVARISGPKIIFTGWLVTPTLVVIPGDVTDTAESGLVEYRCDVFWRGPNEPPDGTSSRFVEVGGGYDERRPAVLRLDHPVAGAEPVRLDLGAVAAGRPIALVSYPDARTGSHLGLGQVTGTRAGLLRHNIAATTGAAGAPLFGASQLGVLGMHLAAGAGGGGVALPLPTILDRLRESLDRAAAPARRCPGGSAGSGARFACAANTPAE